MLSIQPIPGRIRATEGPGGLPLVTLGNAHGRAQVCLYGAQVIDYQPAGQPPVLWLSKHSRFETGQAIRGGIPICWPWFGDHPEDPALPAHGFARTSLWQAIESGIDGEASYLRLRLEDSEVSHRLWPHRFALELLVELDRHLTLTLTTHNPGTQPMTLTEALHSYLQVGDSQSVRLEGLDGTLYRDKLAQLKEARQRGALRVSGALDRVFLHTTGALCLHDPVLTRDLRIEKQGSLSTVIWNPGREKAAAMADFDRDGYRQMVCVEAANALDNRVTVPPGGSHRLATRISAHPRG